MSNNELTELPKSIMEFYKDILEYEGNPLVRAVDGDKPQNSPLEAESLPEDDKRPRR